MLVFGRKPMPYRRIPSLNWLRVFEAAARMESFSGASRVLNMSPAAVSQQVKALETHLKTQLFERGARQVRLTDAGAAFLPVVRQSLMSVETTAASLFGHAKGASVTIAATLIFATSWLPQHLPAFAEQYPDIQVHVTGGYYDTDINREGPDLHVAFGAPRNWGENDYLFGETIYPVAAPQIAQQINTSNDILDHRLIEISTHRTSWLRWFEAADARELADARFSFADASDIALSMAAAGYGIALARSPATNARVAQLGLVRCLPDIEVTSGEAYHLVYRSKESLTPAAKLLRAWLIEASAAER